MTNAKSNIFCPNCGANNKIEQSFCRFCGLNLTGSIKALRTQLADEEKTNQFVKLEWIKRISDFVSIGLIVSVAVILSSIIYSFFTNTEFTSRRLWISLMFLLIFSRSGLSYFRRKNTIGYWEESVEKRAAAGKKLKTLETNKLLQEQPFEPASSVTENSTRLLFAENKTNRLE